ncbi:kinase-like domain-containing protein [Mycena epipterygia]|nr:kinase-like domain-containing protein [Mycena epipterygia]
MTTTNSKTPVMPKISLPLKTMRSPATSLSPSSPPVLPVPPTDLPRGQSLSSMPGAPKQRPKSASPASSHRTGTDTTPRIGLKSPASGSRFSSTYDRVLTSSILEHPPTPLNAPPSTWWGRNLRRDRPWRDPVSPMSTPTSPHTSPNSSPHASPRPAARMPLQGPSTGKNSEEGVDGEERRRLFREPLRRIPTTATIPKEQMEGWERTRERVAQALSRILPPTLLVAHDLPEISSEVLQFVPIPGLEAAANLLLGIWDNVQGVDTNHLTCLRLAERCANLLLSVQQEVHEVGDKVEKEMAKPLEKLVETFTQVRDFLLKQAHRPFLKRYLKREDILGEIASCDTTLSDALSMFSLQVQMRILKQVKETEVRREAENRALLNAIIRSQRITVHQAHLTPRQAPHALPDEHDDIDIRPALRELYSTQNTLDLARDTADLRGVMREALAQSSDVEVLRILQVGRAEMPEALKTLQRELERVGVIIPPPPFTSPPAYMPRGGPLERSESSSGSSAVLLARDTLHHEFIEAGIDALRRMSKGGTMLPSWTITRYEVDRDVKIGMGFFSDVYKGTWQGRTVAIKCLVESTPRDLFLRKVNIWKELKHPNVLELYGASGASGDGPWFFVCPYECFGSLNSFLRHVAQEGEAARTGREGDLLRFMHEIAMGMEYLHDKGVLHGNLKAANVLVDDGIHCVISDFAQTEMKSEVCRISGIAPSNGTLRWQAPELMVGASELTLEMDVYAYAICSVEILSMGRPPWPLLSDEAVRNFVLKDNIRPKIPSTRFDTLALQELLCLCWDKDPSVRPLFTKINKEMKLLCLATELPFEGFEEVVDSETSFLTFVIYSPEALPPQYVLTLQYD